jgi:hypothetical protein
MPDRMSDLFQQDTYTPSYVDPKYLTLPESDLAVPLGRQLTVRNRRDSAIRAQAAEADRAAAETFDRYGIQSGLNNNELYLDPPPYIPSGPIAGLSHEAGVRDIGSMSKMLDKVGGYYNLRQKQLDQVKRK